MYKSVLAFNTGKDFDGFWENLFERESISRCYDCEILDFSMIKEKEPNYSKVISV